MIFFVRTFKHFRFLWTGMILIISISTNASAEINSKPISSPKKINTIIVDNYYPYTFVNKNGDPDGFSVDLIKAVTKVMGMELGIHVDTWEHAKDSLIDGSIDFLPMMAYSKERDTLFDFSVPHTIAYDAFFTRKDSIKISTMDDLKGKMVIVMKDDQAHDYLRSSGLVEPENLIFIKSIPEALRLLASGKGDVALMPKFVGLIVMKDLGLKNLEYSPAVIEAYNRPFSFSVKHGNQFLLERLNQGLSIVKETNQYSEIYEKWFGAIEPKEVSLKEALIYVAGIIGIFLIIGFVLMLWSFSLRKQVASRTRALEDEIMERKRAELALKDSERLLNEVGRIAKIGGWEMDLITNKAKWTKGTYDVVEIEEGQPVPGPNEHIDYYLPEYRPMIAEAMRALIEDDRPLEFEAQLRTAKGNSKWCRAMGQATRKNGECIRVHGTFQDISKEKAIEQELQKYRDHLKDLVKERTIQLQTANQELEAFAYSVSHDLRAPLRAIQGFAEIIARRHQADLNKEGRHYFDNIIQASTQMAQLIQDLLSFSRLGRKALSMSTESLKDIVAPIVDNIKSRPETEGTRIVVPDDMPTLQADHTLLTQIFTNILENAVKYHLPGSPAQVAIACRETSERVTVSIADKGIGIAPDFHEKIFGLFQRLHAQDMYPGTGLGLAIVKKAVQLLGGKVWVESVVDEGSTFWVELPKEGNNVNEFE